MHPTTAHGYSNINVPSVVVEVTNIVSPRGERSSLPRKQPRQTDTLHTKRGMCRRAAISSSGHPVSVRLAATASPFLVENHCTLAQSHLLPMEMLLCIVLYAFRKKFQRSGRSWRVAYDFAGKDCQHDPAERSKNCS